MFTAISITLNKALPKRCEVAHFKWAKPACPFSCLQVGVHTLDFWDTKPNTALQPSTSQGTLHYSSCSKFQILGGTNKPYLSDTMVLSEAVRKPLVTAHTSLQTQSENVKAELG